MDIFIGIVFLIPIILAEIDIFYTIKYLLLQQVKNKNRTLINIISCILSILIITALLLCMFLNYFFSSPFADFVRYALMKPSRSPSMTDWMLPVS